MKLRWKTLLAIASTLVGLNTLLHLISSNVLLNHARLSEERETQQTVQVALNFFNYLQGNFRQRWWDWSKWDNSYKFIKTKDQAFIRDNFKDELFKGLRINLVVFADTEGKILYQKGYSSDLQQYINVPSGITRRLKIGDLLFPPGTQPLAHKTGFLLLPEGAMLLSSQPVTTGEVKGPIAGTVIFGRFLTRDEEKRSIEPLNLPLKIYRIDDPKLPSEALQAKEVIVKGPTYSIQKQSFIKPLSPTLISGYAPIPDIDGNAALLIQVNDKRVIFQKAQETITFLSWTTLMVGSVFGIVTLLLIERLVLVRLFNLNGNIIQISQQGDLSQRVQVSGQDELSQLTISFNQMLEALEIHQQQEEMIKSDLKKAKEIAENAQEQSEQLLLNILPKSIADRLKQNTSSIAEHFENATILFADIVGFTSLSAHLHPTELVHFLNQIFSTFDALAEKHQLEKIKTIGDAYMVVGGLPLPRADHAAAVADMALEMQEAIAQFSQRDTPFQVRIGINTGTVVAGVIGKKKFIYDLWGDAVNVASRMESHGEPGRIQVTAETYEQLKEEYVLESRGTIAVKGRGQMETYWLLEKRGSSLT